MQQLTPQGQQRVNDIAQQYEISTNAVMTLLQALIQGQGSMAQFNHPELGGNGQWMQGGMTMVGDMFNDSLKAMINNLCQELSQIIAQKQFIQEVPTEHTQSQRADSSIPLTTASNWWPAELGTPNMTGAQNQMRYAYFADKKRLVIEIKGQLTVFDTLDHQLSGVSQQQGTSNTLTFTSQHGTLDLLSLPIVAGFEPPPAASDSGIKKSPPTETQHAEVSQTKTQHSEVAQPEQNDIFAKIERLAELKQKGIITEAEFTEKKKELLSRV